VNHVETLLGLAEHHEAQARYFQAFGAHNPLTEFHSNAAEICRGQYADTARLHADWRTQNDSIERLLAALEDARSWLSAFATIVNTSPQMQQIDAAIAAARSKNMTPKQVENLRVAYSVMWGVPADRIDLGSVRRDCDDDDEFLSPACRSVGCVAGFLSAHPHFKAQGLRWTGDGVMLTDSSGRSYHLEEAANELFGGWSVFNAGPSGLEGKRRALEHIRRALLEAGAITLQRNAELARQEQEIVA
jgi:hypothetical protein